MRAILVVAALGLLTGCTTGGEVASNDGHATWDQAATIMCKEWPPARAELDDCRTVFVPIIEALFSSPNDASRATLLDAAKASLHPLAPYDGISPGRQGPGIQSIAAGALFGLQTEEMNDSMTGYKPTRAQILATALIHAFPRS